MLLTLTKWRPTDSTNSISSILLMLTLYQVETKFLFNSVIFFLPTLMWGPRNSTNANSSMLLMLTAYQVQTGKMSIVAYLAHTHQVETIEIPCAVCSVLLTLTVQQVGTDNFSMMPYAADRTPRGGGRKSFHMLVESMGPHLVSVSRIWQLKICASPLVAR